MSDAGKDSRSENVVSEHDQHVQVRDPGQALQDQDRIAAEERHADANDHEGSPVRSRPDLVPGAPDKALEEVRRVREENERRARTHNRVVVEEEVAASTTSGSAKSVELRTAGGLLYLNTHGEAVLDHDGVIDLRRKLDKAFQAVS